MPGVVVHIYSSDAPEAEAEELRVLIYLVLVSKPKAKKPVHNQNCPIHPHVPAYMVAHNIPLQ